MRRPAVVIIIFIVSLILFSCSREEADEPSAEADASVEETETLPSDPSEDDVGDATAMDLTAEGEERTRRDERVELDPRQSAFAANRQRGVALFPVDYIIGPLGPARSGAGRRAWWAAFNLLTWSVSGAATDPPLDVAQPDLLVLRDLSRSYEPSGGDESSGQLGETAVRLGLPEALSAESFSMRFRIEGGVNNFIGEIVLDVDNGVWYTAGVQVIPAELGRAQYAPDSDIPATTW